MLRASSRASSSPALLVGILRLSARLHAICHASGPPHRHRLVMAAFRASREARGRAPRRYAALVWQLGPHRGNGPPLRPGALQYKNRAHPRPGRTWGSRLPPAPFRPSISVRPTVRPAGGGEAWGPQSQSRPSKCTGCGLSFVRVSRSRCARAKAPARNPQKKRPMKG